MAGHIIAIVGGKGGVGKSVFAANLTLAYVKNFRQRPLIIDLDFQSLGDQNLILGQTSPKTIVDLSKLQTQALDPKSLGPLLANSSQGFSFLSAPRDVIATRDLDLDGLGKALKGITQVFPLVVIDCGSSMDAATMKALEHATAIFVVTSCDIIVLNQTRRILSKIQELLFPPEMVQVVVNRYTEGSIVSLPIVQKNLNRQAFAVIPEEAGTCENALAKNTPFVVGAPGTAIARAYNDLVRKMFQSNMLDKLATLKKPSGLSAQLQAAQAQLAAVIPIDSGSGGGLIRSRAAALDPWTAMKMRIHRALVDKMDLKKMTTDFNDEKERAVLKEKTNRTILEIISTEDTGSLLTTRELKAQMAKEVLDEALGLGPLEDLLGDDSVTEIMVNARDQIYVERSGKNFLSKINFTSEQQMMNVIERIVTPLGRRVDEKTPYVDARLRDGSRVHVIIPPLALRGPTITIRKFPKTRITSKDLVEKFGSMTNEIADFLRACVEAKLNVVISGGTGSGKTTLLNVLSNFIPVNERIVTIEDSAELQLGQDHVVRLETRPKNIEGEGEVAIRDLVKASLRMRPDRIVVGECRAGEAFDMLQAMSTGHDGSLTTLHANNPRDCLSRLENLVRMAGLGLESKGIRELITSSVNLIVQQSRLSDGSRKITHISEVSGMQGDVISLQDIFTFQQDGLDKRRKVIGRFVPSGYIPKFVELMEQKGMKISRGLFATR